MSDDRTTTSDAETRERVRTRVRNRGRGGTRPASDGQSESMESQEAAADTDRADTDRAAAAEDDGAVQVIRRRRSRRAPDERDGGPGRDAGDGPRRDGGDDGGNERPPAAAAPEPSAPDVDDPADQGPTEPATASAPEAGDDAPAEQEEGGGAAQRQRSRRRSRGRGGRGRKRSSTRPAAGRDQQPERAAPDAGEEAEEAPAPDTQDSARPSPTRLQARGRGRAGRQPRTTRAPARGMSEDARRAIADGPPRRMLATVGEKHTQIAVLEERDLVEHYVTHKEDVSYVGNIYLGRVQNVLPGMEAAFVDVGKGRNGVLYAGEVNYDEADLDDQLPRIEETLKPGQSVLVQVTKDPMGTKGARLTQHLSIAGRYCVLAPNDGMLGISRKLPDEERDRLRKILKSVKPESFGLIVRTAAEGASGEQLEADVARLVRIWDQVQERAKDAKPLEAVYEEPDLVIRVIRDTFGPEYTELIVDSAELGAKVREYLGDVSPELVDRITVYEGEEKLFDGYEVTNQIRRALEKKVWLASGGYLIVEKTEAMWVIDVNTGKFVGQTNLEETVLRNNLEAAEEIARQLRLRDMGGIIVIDFVDMLVPANRDEVLKRFRRELARDKTKSRVMDISKLGLVQMTRKNVSRGLTESFTKTCETCEGRGATIVDHLV